MTANFQSRLAKLGRKHHKMVEEGVHYRIGRDGLISVGPKRPRVSLFPFRTLALLLLAAFAFKALMFAALGEDTYRQRLDALAAGNAIERAGAWAMHADPATTIVGGILGAVAG